MRNKIVLMYHDIYIKDAKESGFPTGLQYKVCADLFEAHVKAVAGFCKTHGNVEVEFTFDDGGVSFLTVAAPILEKFGYRGVFFISTQYIGTPTFLSMEQVKELRERGHRIGSHSHTHPSMQGLSAEEVWQEWNLSVPTLKPFNGELVEASIPNGYGSNTVLRLAKEAGIERLYTSEPTTKVKHYDGMELIGRYAVYHNTTVDEVLSIVGSRKKRMKMLMRSKMLLTAQKMLGPLYMKIKKRLLKVRQ